MTPTMSGEEASHGPSLDTAQGHVAGDAPFRVDSSTVKEQSIRGGAITVGSRAISYGIQVVSTIILVRLLSPEDHGLIAMVAAVTNFARVFQDLGLSAATVQRKDITEDQVSTLFWINTVVGLLLAVCVAAVAPAVSLFYGRSELTHITLAIASTFFIVGMSVQPHALLVRQMRFRAIAVVEITSMVVALALAATLALQGAGYWALVSHSVVLQSMTTAGLWIASRWLPRRPSIAAGVRDLMSFGAQIASFGVVHYFARNVDGILIARFWGAQQVGLYTKAYALLTLPVESLSGPLNRVAFPALSALQHEPHRLRAYFVRLASIVAFAALPILGFIFVFAERIVLLLLGSQWLGAAELCRILAAATFLQPVIALNGLLLMSMGQGQRYLRWGVFNATTFVLAYGCGVPWGASGVALAYCAANYLILHPNMLFAYRHTPVRPADFYRAISVPCLATAAMILAGFATKPAFVTLPNAIALVASFAICAAVYLAVTSLTPVGRRSLLDYWEYGALLLRRRTGPALETAPTEV